MGSQRVGHDCDSIEVKRRKEAGAARPAGPCGLKEDFGFYLEGGGRHGGSEEKKDVSGSGPHTGKRLQGKTARAGRTRVSALAPSMMGLD